MTPSNRIQKKRGPKKTQRTHLNNPKLKTLHPIRFEICDYYWRCELCGQSYPLPDSFRSWNDLLIPHLARFHPTRTHNTDYHRFVIETEERVEEVTKAFLKIWWTGKEVSPISSFYAWSVNPVIRQNQKRTEKRSSSVDRSKNERETKVDVVLQSKTDDDLPSLRLKAAALKMGFIQYAKFLAVRKDQQTYDYSDLKPFLIAGPEQGLKSELGNTFASILFHIEDGEKDDWLQSFVELSKRPDVESRRAAARVVPLTCLVFKSDVERTTISSILLALSQDPMQAVQTDLINFFPGLFNTMPPKNHRRLYDLFLQLFGVDESLTSLSSLKMAMSKIAPKLLDEFTLEKILVDAKSWIAWPNSDLITLILAVLKRFKQLEQPLPLLNNQFYHIRSEVHTKIIFQICEEGDERQKEMGILILVELLRNQVISTEKLKNLLSEEIQRLTKNPNEKVAETMSLLREVILDSGDEKWADELKEQQCQ